MEGKVGSVLVGFAFVRILLQLTVSSTVQASAAWKTKISLKTTTNKIKNKTGKLSSGDVSKTKGKTYPGIKTPVL